MYIFDLKLRWCNHERRGRHHPHLQQTASLNNDVQALSRHTERRVWAGGNKNSMIRYRRRQQAQKKHALPPRERHGWRLVTAPYNGTVTLTPRTPPCFPHTARTHDTATTETTPVDNKQLRQRRAHRPTPNFLAAVPPPPPPIDAGWRAVGHGGRQVQRRAAGQPHSCYHPPAHAYARQRWRLLARDDAAPEREANAERLMRIIGRPGDAVPSASAPRALDDPAARRPRLRRMLGDG